MTGNGPCADDCETCESPKEEPARDSRLSLWVLPALFKKKRPKEARPHG